MPTWKKRIVLNPEILTGKPVVKGTRLSVDFVLELLAQGWSKEEVLKNYPQLKEKDLKAVTDHSAKLLRTSRSTK